MSGLAAKPIVDILVSLRAIAPRDPCTGPLRDLGYRWVIDSEDDVHEYFSRDVDDERVFQVHACLAGSAFEQRHPAFRDWLCGHPADAAVYADLKRRLAALHPGDPLTYTDDKTDFIRSIEAKAAAADRAAPPLRHRSAGR